MKLSTRRLSTGAALIALAVLFLALVVASGALFRGARLDLTQRKLYTLTDGTKAILSKIEEPINLTFYYSEQAARELPAIRTYATRVQELLEEMASRAGGGIRLSIVDPQPFSEDEDRATAAGLQAIPLGNSGNSLFLGLAGSNSTDGTAAIPFFQPDKEAFLEYDLAKLISSLANDARPVVGLMSNLPMGPSFDPAAGRPTEGWVIDGELRKLFDVKRVETNVVAIPDDINTLMVVHPRGLSEDTQYAIDQFVLRGGRLLAFVDPSAEAQKPGQDADPAMAALDDKSSDLPLLFKAWGVHYDPRRVVLDARLAVEVQIQQGRPPVRHPAILGLTTADLNQNDIVSAELGSVNLSSAGAFSLADGSALTAEPLAQSSATASTAEANRLGLTPDPSALYDDFTPTGERYALAVRLTGKLKTAFPDRSGEKHLAQSVNEANIILIADTDVLTDRLWAQSQQFFGQRVVNAFAGNGDFVINAVDNLIGSSDLIAVRTRAGGTAPFTTVESLKATADARFRTKEQELEQQLSATEQKLAALQSQRQDGNSLSLTPEQQAELLRFQDEKLRIRKELRQVRRELDEDIQTLGRKLKFLNIAGVPLLLTLGALAWVFIRRRNVGRTA